MDEMIFTQEEMDELVSLRKEKKLREQTAIAESQLEKYGVPKDFAGFLVGENDESTLNNVKRFSESFSRVKMSLVAPAPAPKDDFTPPKRHRGVRRA